MRGKACSLSNAHRGFSYLELVIVIALIATLIAVAAHRLVPYAAEAERVALQRLESQLRNVLVLEAAQLIARGQSNRLGELDFVNPLALVLEPPGTYLGELNAPTHALLPIRSWHFDTSTRRLVYRAGRGFEATDGAPVIYQYVTRVTYADRDNDERYSIGIDEFQGVRLYRLDPDKPDANMLRSVQVLAARAAMSTRVK